MRTETDDLVGFVPEDDIGFEPEQSPIAETPSLQPVLNAPGFPQEPVARPERTPQFSPFQPLPPENRVTQVGTTSGATDSLLDFIPELPKLTEEQAQALGQIPVMGGIPMGPTAAKFAAGAANVPVQFAKGITTPLGLVTLGEGAIARAAGTPLADLLVTRATQPLFAAEMATGAVRAVPEAIGALREGDIQKAAQTGLGGVASGILAGHLASTPLDRIMAEADASPTPISAATVAGMREAATSPSPGMVRITDFDFRPTEPAKPIEEVPNAEAIRGSEGQLPAPGIATEGGQAPSGNVLERTPSEQPKSVEQGEAQATEATPGPSAAEVAPTPEAVLSAKVEELPAKSATLEAAKESIEEQQKLGIRPTPLPVVRGTPILDIVKGIRDDIAGIRKFTPFRESLNKWVGSLQDSNLKVSEMTKALESRVPSEKRRNAITNWIQADGDATVLADRARSTKDRKLQEGYIDATRLTPDELKIADEIRTFYANKATELENAGVLSNVVDNYVTQIWKRAGIPTAARFAGKLARNFKFNRARTFKTFHEGEQAGFKPATKDISKLVAVYSAEADKVLATRKMIEDLTTKTASDGRPLAVPSGIVKLAAESEPGTRLVLPNITGKDFSDYEAINHPALAKWKWGETDPTTGVDTMVLGNLKIHPEAAKYVRNALDRPWLRKWYDEPSGPAMHLLKGSVRVLERAGGEMKRTMLSASGFHIVQEGTHALGHRVNPFFGLPEIKAGDPKIQEAMNHGLMLAGEHTGAEQFREGITGGGLLSKIPGIGRVIDQISDFTFKVYIPKLKYKTYEKMVARNTHVFDKELKSGEVTPADIKALSAEQSNAAYGHLNYADMGRNPNFQQFLRTVFLAPDFLEARGRFAAQAAKGLVSKTGREQLTAMASLGALFWIAARIGNQLEDGDPHYERPFEVKAGNRWYSMRSVPEDIFKLFKDTRQFVNGRLSPMFGQTIRELAEGRNYRGEKVTASEALGEMMTRWIPISFRNIPGLRSLSESTRQNPVSPWESFLGSSGLHVSRYSPITETYRLAADWNKAHNVPMDRGTYPVSKYQQLRYALEDTNMTKASDEITKLHQAGLTRDKIRSGFKESVLHPFTQNRTTDEQFRRSLDGKERAVYDEAVRLRQRLINRLDSVLR